MTDQGLAAAMRVDRVMDQEYAFDLQVAEDDGFKQYLQGILNDYHEKVYPLMEVPRSQRFVIRVNDPAGNLVGGALFWALPAWGWVDVTVLALEEAVRGKVLFATLED